MESLFALCRRQPTPRPSPSQEGETGDRIKPTPRPSQEGKTGDGIKPTPNPSQPTPNLSQPTPNPSQEGRGEMGMSEEVGAKFCPKIVLP
ncbi:hypothetical protein [Okeania sp. SIO1I7]|uniref:hypothetical protein n=1 Tax=Okeania sp. SIO1I7 TaxID=2607772 RepID=UPI0013FB25B3|nr:hypothetical protein [Okeania sp. SIO1I7]NET28202.1 hypothetical protein [Okeania sp. SIO1I7]